MSEGLVANGDIEMQSQSTSAAAEPTQEDIDRKPWKYLGYHSFSHFVASDNDFFILRRYGALNARILLRLQDQISQLEEQLNALEDHLRSKDGPRVHNGTFRQDNQKGRTHILAKIRPLLHEYSE